VPVEGVDLRGGIKRCMLRDWTYFDSADGVEGEFDVGDRYLKIEMGVIRCHIRYTCERGQLTSSWLYLA
jgi:hypothetical protein